MATSDYCLLCIMSHWIVHSTNSFKNNNSFWYEMVLLCDTRKHVMVHSTVELSSFVEQKWTIIFKNVLILYILNTESCIQQFAYTHKKIIWQRNNTAEWCWLPDTNFTGRWSQYCLLCIVSDLIIQKQWINYELNGTTDVWYIETWNSSLYCGTIFICGAKHLQ